MDRDRIGISKQELVSMLEVIVIVARHSLFSSPVTLRVFLRDVADVVVVWQEDELKNAVLCVYANKQDIEGAMSVTEVALALGLSNVKNRKYQIFKTSAIKGEGLDDAMEWCVLDLYRVDCLLYVYM